MSISIPQEFMDDAIPESKPMPTGMYDLIVLSQSWENYRSPELASKTYLLVDFKVTTEEYEGQRIFCRFNIYHPNKKAQQFSWFLLRQLATALGQDVSSGEVDPDDFDGGKVKAWVEAGQHEKYGLQLDAKKFFKKDHKPGAPGAQPQVKTAKPASKFKQADTAEDLPW